MNFNEAWCKLINGKCIARDKWDVERRISKVVFLQIPSIIPSDIIPKMQSLPESAKTIIRVNEPKSLHYTDQMAIMDISNKNEFVVSGYSPSVEDVMASDWYSL